MTTISGSGAHASVAGSDRAPFSKAGTKGFHDVDALQAYLAVRTTQETVTALRAIDAAADIVDGTKVIVLGDAALGDCAPFVVEWSAASSAANDGLFVFRPTAGAASSGNGRWLRTDGLGRGAVTPTVATITALKAVPKGFASTVYVAGRAAVNDGGQGDFYWDAASSETGDDVMIVAPTAGGAGRWKRAYAGNVAANWWLRTDGVDMSTEFAAMITWLTAQTRKPRCTFYGDQSKVFGYNTCPNLALENQDYDFVGEVRFRNLGSGIAIELDGGDDSPTGVHNCHFGLDSYCVIEGHDGSGHAIRARAFHDGRVQARVKGCGTTSAGLKTQGCTGTYFDVQTNVNHEGWYDDGSGAAIPQYGLDVDKNATQGPSSYCTFICNVAGVAYGVYRRETLGCTFVGEKGRAVQGCTHTGNYGGVNSFGDKFIDLDFEANTNQDIDENGKHATYQNCDTNNEIVVRSGAEGIVIDGGLHKDITLASGSAGCLVTKRTTYNRENMGGVLTDSGHGNIIEPGVRNGTSNLRESSHRRIFRLGDKGIFAGATLPAGWATKLGSGDTAIRMANGLGGGVEFAAGNNVAGTFATNGVQLDQGILQWYAVSGGLQIEFGGVDFDSIANCAWFFGFTDQFSALEMPFYSAASGDTITSDTSNGFGFLFDTAMATDNWWLVGCKANTDTTPQNVGAAPVAGTPSRLRMEVSDAGAVKFFINDVQVGTTMANAVTTSTLLTPVAAGFSRTNAYKTAYVKYIDAEVRR